MEGVECLINVHLALNKNGESPREMIAYQGREEGIKMLLLHPVRNAIL